MTDNKAEPIQMSPSLKAPTISVETKHGLFFGDAVNSPVTELDEAAVPVFPTHTVPLSSSRRCD